MSYYLIAEEGPFAGLQINVGKEARAVLGRDPDLASLLIEDSSISRRHALFSQKEGRLFIENLSLTNPIQVNGLLIEGETPLEDGDFISLGTLLFRLKKRSDGEEKQSEEEPLLFIDTTKTRYYIKVVSGPNQGAESPILLGQAYLLGKSDSDCDIVFEDQSVSKKHARLFFDEKGRPTVEDLQSRNGTFVNQRRVHQPQELKGQELITLGTTQFLFVDRNVVQETLYTPIEEKLPPEEGLSDEERLKKLVIPYNHLFLGGALLSLFLLGSIFLVSLFNSTELPLSMEHHKEELAKVFKKFSQLEYTFNETSGRLFLVGHLLNDLQHEELLYSLRQLPFIEAIENTIVIDEGVWQNANPLLQSYPQWKNVLVTAIQPGQFVLRGYVETPLDQATLMEYMALHFPYLNRLKEEVHVSQVIENKIQALLLEQGFSNVTFNFAIGDLFFNGVVSSKEKENWNLLIKHLSQTPGIQQIESAIAFSSEATSRINLSERYQINGTSTQNGVYRFVLINGKILSPGKMLDGMLITKIENKAVLLEKDGLKYKIDFNQ